MESGNAANGAFGPNGEYAATNFANDLASPGLGGGAEPASAPVARSDGAGAFHHGFEFAGAAADLPQLGREAGPLANGGGEGEMGLVEEGDAVFLGSVLFDVIAPVALGELADPLQRFGRHHLQGTWPCGDGARCR